MIIVKKYSLKSTYKICNYRENERKREKNEKRNSFFHRDFFLWKYLIVYIVKISSNVSYIILRSQK